MRSIPDTEIELVKLGFAMNILGHRDNELQRRSVWSLGKKVPASGDADVGHVQWLCLLMDSEVSLSFYKVCGKIDGS